MFSLARTNAGTPAWLWAVLYRAKAARARRLAWRRLIQAEPDLKKLPVEERAEARRAAELIADSHRVYLSAFNSITAESQEIFEKRAWAQGSFNAEARVRLYRTSVTNTWATIRRLFPERLPDRSFWMAARHVFLERVFNDYEADLALTFFYSLMRLAFDPLDTPVEYADDGLAESSHIWNPHPVWDLYPAAGLAKLADSVALVLRRCGFRAPFENAARDARLVTARISGDWHARFSRADPRSLRILRPVFYRDREAYIVGDLTAPGRSLPIVLALRNDESGIGVDAVLTGHEDMRNILFVSTRSTFHVRTDDYREVLAFLDTLAPERGHPAMCAVLGFTHPARVALNQKLRQHLRDTGERLARTPGRVGMAMLVFAPPTFPYVFKIVRDFSSKPEWVGRERIMDLYRWVHEINRGRLMLDAWMYRNVEIARRHFDESLIEELRATAPSSVRIERDRVLLKHMYAQRKVRPLNTFFDETQDPALRERAGDALGTFVKDLAGMGFFVGDCYGLTFNTGLTHGFHVALFDFDDLGPLFRYRFRETPPPASEQDELWNSEVDGAWFPVEPFDVLVDEWERFLGVPADLTGYFRRKHGEIFTTAYWADVQRRVASGELHYTTPYPPERRLYPPAAEPAGNERASV